MTTNFFLLGDLRGGAPRAHVRFHRDRRGKES